MLQLSYPLSSVYACIMSERLRQSKMDFTWMYLLNTPPYVKYEESQF